MWVYPVHGMLSLAINCTNYPSNGPGGDGGVEGRRGGETPWGADNWPLWPCCNTFCPSDKAHLNSSHLRPKKNLRSEGNIKLGQRKPSKTPKHMKSSKGNRQTVHDLSQPRCPTPHQGDTSTSSPNWRKGTGAGCKSGPTMGNAPIITTCDPPPTRGSEGKTTLTWIHCF